MDPGGGPSDGHTFGQRQPPLYVTIQKILDKYPDGQIFKVGTMQLTIDPPPLLYGMTMSGIAISGMQKGHTG